MEPSLLSESGLQAWLGDHKFSKKTRHELKSYTGKDLFLLFDLITEKIGAYEGAKLRHHINPIPVTLKPESTPKNVLKWLYQMGFSPEVMAFFQDYTGQMLQEGTQCFLERTWTECRQLIQLKLEKELGKDDALKLALLIHAEPRGSFPVQMDAFRVGVWLRLNGFDSVVVSKLEGYDRRKLQVLSKPECIQVLGEYDGTKLYLLMKGYTLRGKPCELKGPEADIWLRQNGFSEAAIYVLRIHNGCTLSEEDEVHRVLGDFDMQNGTDFAHKLEDPHESCLTRLRRKGHQYALVHDKDN